MIISHKHKFIFIKTAKTAGTSIEAFLSKQCGVDDVVTPIFPPIESHEPRNFQQGAFFNHMKARQIRRRITPNIWNNYYKFCVERNPWDKTLSHYYMERYRADVKLEFATYLERKQFCINFPSYTNRMGQLIIDEVIPYENLSSELTRVFNQLGIPFGGDLGVRAKSEYRTDRRHYREILNCEQAELIKHAFRAEIKMHNYIY